MHLYILTVRIFALQNLDQWAQAELGLRQAREFASRTGIPDQSTWANAAVLRYWLGQWDDALAELGDDDAGAHGYLRERWPSLLIHGVTALIAGHREQRATAEAALKAGPGAADREPHRPREPGLPGRRARAGARAAGRARPGHDQAGDAADQGRGRDDAGPPVAARPGQAGARGRGPGDGPLGGAGVPGRGRGRDPPRPRRRRQPALPGAARVRPGPAGRGGGALPRGRPGRRAARRPRGPGGGAGRPRPRRRRQGGHERGDRPLRGRAGPLGHPAGRGPPARPRRQPRRPPPPPRPRHLRLGRPHPDRSQGRRPGRQRRLDDGHRAADVPVQAHCPDLHLPHPHQARRQEPSGDRARSRPPGLPL